MKRSALTQNSAESALVNIFRAALAAVRPAPSKATLRAAPAASVVAAQHYAELHSDIPHVQAVAPAPKTQRATTPEFLAKWARFLPGIRATLGHAATPGSAPVAQNGLAQAIATLVGKSPEQIELAHLTKEIGQLKAERASLTHMESALKSRLAACYQAVGIPMSSVSGKSGAEINALLNERVRALAAEQVQAIGFPLRSADDPDTDSTDAHSDSQTIRAELPRLH